MSVPFSGIITAIVTPFNRDFSIDEPGFIKLVKRQKASNINGIIISGTTGESPTLSITERKRLLELALNEQTSNFRIYVGSGSNNTQESVEGSKDLANYVAKNGERVSGLMAVVPYYNKPSQQGLFLHFNAIAKAIEPLSFCIYNVPGRCSANILPSTFFRLAEQNSNICAIKEAAGDVKVFVELDLAVKKLAKSGRIVNLLSGDDLTFASAVVSGCQGLISVSSNLFPKTIMLMQKAVQENNLFELKRLHQLCYPLSSALFVASNPVPLKYALNKLDLCSQYLRLPMCEMELKEAEFLDNIINEAKQSGVNFE